MATGEELRAWPAYREMLLRAARTLIEPTGGGECVSSERCLEVYLRDTDPLVGTSLARWDVSRVIQQTIADSLQCRSELGGCLLAPQISWSACHFLMLHRMDGQLLWRMPWPVLERLLQVAIDRSLRPSDGIGSVPCSFWLELEGQPSALVPRWLQQARGMLVSLWPVFDAPSDIITASAMANPRGRNADETIAYEDAILYEAVREGSGSMFGYALFLLAKSGHNSVIQTFWGGARSSSVTDSVALAHQSITATGRKTRDIEKAMVAIAARLILLAGCRGLFSSNLSVSTDTSSLQEVSDHASSFVPSAKRGKRKISLSVKRGAPHAPTWRD